MNESLLQLEALRQHERRVAVATLIATQGTSPRQAGATMFVGEAGRIVGSVTIGGCIDGQVIAISPEVMESGTARRITMSLGDEDAWELGMTCAGSVDLLVEAANLSDAADPLVEAFDVTRRELDSGRSVVSVAALSGPTRRLLLREDGSTLGTLGSAALDAEAAQLAASLLAARNARTLVTRTAHGTELFLEVHAAPPLLAIVGATHLAMPLVPIARSIGHRVVVIDGRERFATRDRFPDADDIRVGFPSEIVEELRLTKTSAVVLVSHDYKYDVPVLKSALASDAGYIGVLGSRRRGEALLSYLADDGVDRGALARVHIPIGLDIGARSPAEIAISIAAELIAVRSGRSSVASMASARRHAATSTPQEGAAGEKVADTER